VDLILNFLKVQNSAISPVNTDPGDRIFTENNDPNEIAVATLVYEAGHFAPRAAYPMTDAQHERVTRRRAKREISSESWKRRE
jgi:hypothetical protein